MHRYRADIRRQRKTGGRREAVGVSRKTHSRVVFVPHSDSLESGINSGRPSAWKSLQCFSVSH